MRMTTTVLGILAALPGLINIILELMKAVETEMGSGTGPDKKTAVLSSLQAVIGDPTVWTKLQTFFAGLINVLALMHFGAKN